VSPTDGSFHASFNHYSDNLSARQCHDKPLPCKLINGVNSTTCVTQHIADEVYRFGHWEYSYIYRDSSTSLNAATGSFGVWIAGLATHIRDLISGKSDVIYRHNVAHDGSVSRLLSFLQIDVMVWPGMGSEVVFEVWQKTGGSTSEIAPDCNHDNCLRQFIQESSKVSAFCLTYTAKASSSASSNLRL
jgi:acid phosphatase